MSNTPKRLIEVAFPLKQTSLDSVHEKNVRHGHISTLHIWPARRPLAACRAALIATLLPDPGDPEERKQILERLAGKVVQKTKRKKTENGWVEEVTEETEGGILHWGRESGPDLDWFRQKIREAYGGRAPKVLDPFAGGGAIPLEAMRLGCEATAVDINPVAWFILKCTLEYPQKLAGQKRPLPDFAVQDQEFMEQYMKAQGFKGKALAVELEKFGFGVAANPQLPGVETGRVSLEADLAWHVRAWGRWVLKEARKELAPYYPTYADFEPLEAVTGKVERRPMTLVPLTADGEPDVDSLNAEFTPEYLADRRNPRWVAKPTVAYLWARTVTCKNCRATIPLLKTRWLCKKDRKRVVLTMQPNPEKTGVIFGVQNDVPVVGKTAAEKRSSDLRLGSGTISRSGATCPCCSGIMTTEDIRLEGQAGRIKAMMTAIVVDGLKGKEYRIPSIVEENVKRNSENNSEALEKLLSVDLDTSLKPASTRSISCHLYGIDNYQKLFSPSQRMGLRTIGRIIHDSSIIIGRSDYAENWGSALISFIALAFDRLLSFNCVLVRWKIDAEAVVDAFARFSISILWDFAESLPIGESAGAWSLCYERIATALDTYNCFPVNTLPPLVLNTSATEYRLEKCYDLIITDPPYYQAISYADLSDFFYVWLRSVFPYKINEFKLLLTLKEQEIVQHIREDKDRIVEKEKYENGMYEAFLQACQNLSDNGRFVCVFAHKDPEAWETLVSAMIKAGLVVTASWPIQTEMLSRQRASQTAALASSVWLVCKKRSPIVRPGWDNKVLDEMRANITTQLRDFWDAGIRGPDFVWAATGPAMEAYSQYPVVKKANEPGAVMTVTEFLTHVRRMVVDFVVGRVLTGDGVEAVTGLDNITTYYLLHRHDFGANDAPAGPCILYAVSCGLSDKDLADRYDLLARRGGKEQADVEEEDEGESEEGSGSSFRLKAWNQRKNPRMGYDPATDSGAEKLPLFPGMERDVQPSREIPLIDQVHRLMHLWKGGDVSKVNEYLDLRGLRRNPLFHQLLQALIELAPAGSEERSLMESISNHVGGRQHNVYRQNSGLF